MSSRGSGIEDSIDGRVDRSIDRFWGPPRRNSHHKVFLDKERTL